MQLTTKENWGLVSGTDNPAGLGSRGISASLRDSTWWWKGPHWLGKGIDSWPKAFLLEDSTDIGSERKMGATVLVNTEESVGVHNIIEIRIHHNLAKLLRATAYVQRFIEN